MGVTMHKHYCMGRVKDVAYFEKSKHCAEMIGMEQEDCPMSCCKDTEQEQGMQSQGAPDETGDRIRKSRSLAT